jgi:hypothetical protein
MLQDLAKTWHMAAEKEVPKFRKLDGLLQTVGKWTGRDAAHQE